MRVFTRRARDTTRRFCHAGKWAGVLNGAIALGYQPGFFASVYVLPRRGPWVRVPICDLFIAFQESVELQQEFQVFVQAVDAYLPYRIRVHGTADTGGVEVVLLARDSVRKAFTTPQDHHAATSFQRRLRYLKTITEGHA